MSSHLECLPSVLFDHICMFLPFDDKCRNISRLSHRANQLFDISRCCKHDTIRITDEFAFESLNKQSTKQSVIKQSKRLLLCRSVRSIVCANSPLLHNDPTILVALVTAVQGKYLRSLVLHEPEYHDLTSDSTTLIEQLPLLGLPKSLSLNRLLLSCHPHSLQSEGWNILNQCRSLTSLTLDLPCGHGFFSREVDTSPMLMFDCLPASITHLKVTRVTMQSIQWSKAFALPTFLPFLRSFEASNDEYLGSEALEALSTTLIPQHNHRFVNQSKNQSPCIRHIQCIPMHITDIHHLRPLTKLHTIRIKLDSSGVHHLVKLPYVTFKNLRSFYVHIVASKTDPAPVSSLLEYLSQPTIEEVSIYVPRYGGRPLRDAAVVGLSNLRHLKKLDIEITGQDRLFDSIDIQNLLPRSCWPRLATLRLAYTRCSIIHITEMLLAAPNLINCMLTAVFSTGVDAATIVSSLFMCGIFCPAIKRIHLSMYDHTHICGLREVARSLLLYPPPITAFRNLVSLQMNGLKMDDAALHLLMVKLNSPPKLRWFFGDIVQSKRAADWQPAIGRSLSSFILLCHLPVFEPRCEKWFSSVVDTYDLPHDLVETIPCKGRDQLGTDGAADEFCNSCLLTGHVRSVKSHIQFRTSVDVSGKDGRSACWDAIRSSLTLIDKQKIALWDAGVYDQDDTERLGLLKPSLLSPCIIM